MTQRIYTTGVKSIVSQYGLVVFATPVFLHHFITRHHGNL